MRLERRRLFLFFIAAIALAACRLALGESRAAGSDAGLEEALAAMSSPVERVRLEAVTRLAKTGRPEAVARLVKALDDISFKVRVAAIHGLETMGPQAADAAKPLLELFKKEPAYRNQVLKALLAVAPENEDVGKLLLDIAIAKKNNKILLGADRAFAVANLGRVRAGDRAVPVLIDVAREAAKDLDTQFHLYKIALRSLEEIGSTKQGVLPALRAFRKGNILRGVNPYHVRDAKTLADTLLRKLEAADKERAGATGSARESARGESFEAHPNQPTASCSHPKSQPRHFVVKR